MRVDVARRARGGGAAAAKRIEPLAQRRVIRSDVQSTGVDEAVAAFGEVSDLVGEMHHKFVIRVRRNDRRCGH